MRSTPQSGSTLESARMVTRFLLQEPVKDAVKEALYEEGLGSRPDTDRSTAAMADADADGSGPSRLLVGAVLVGLGGLAYVVRQRRQSGPGWSADETHQQEPRHGAADTATAGSAGGRDESTTVGDGP